MVILHGIILRVRPAKSAHKYASIWTPEGSPLKAWTEKQAMALQQRFDRMGASVQVRCAMTYGQPAIAGVLDELKAQGVTRVLVLPAYPQYSGTTTAAVFDAIYRWSMRTRLIPEWRFVNRYHDDAGYIGALADTVQAHWQQHGRGDQLVMSFHGVPENTLMQGDPYHCECHKTARLLAERLGIGDAGVAADRRLIPRGQSPRLPIRTCRPPVAPHGGVLLQPALPVGAPCYFLQELLC